MPNVLSLAFDGQTLYAAGPEGLFRSESTELHAVPQPMASLYCAATVAGTLLVGGAPFGTARLTASGEWQGGWMDHTRAPVVAIAPAPGADQNGLLLAATAGDGILRSTDGGRAWTLCNYGLRDFTILCVAWAPAPPVGRWPARTIAFCGSERALYRSPAAGLGWSHVAEYASAVQTIAVSPGFHDDGIVLAGTEEDGLWRSDDDGRTFTLIDGPPHRIDALIAIAAGWLAATPEGIWSAPANALAWTAVADSSPALCLAKTDDGVVAGGEDGIAWLAIGAPTPAGLSLQ